MVLTYSANAFSVCLDTVTVNTVLKYHTWGDNQARYPLFKMGILYRLPILSNVLFLVFNSFLKILIIEAALYTS